MFDTYIQELQVQCEKAHPKEDFKIIAFIKITKGNQLIKHK